MKNKTTILNLIIILLFIGILYSILYRNNNFLINKSKVEDIAMPILKNCWENDKFTIQDLDSKLYFKSENPSINDGKPYWVVGADYSTKDFGIEKHKEGYIPEVYIDAKTGEVIYKHFTEIGEAPGGYGCNNEDDFVTSSGPDYPETYRLFEEYLSKNENMNYKIDELSLITRKKQTFDPYYLSGFTEDSSAEAFIAAVDYSLKPKDNTPQAQTEAIAGNGELQADGWVTNKFLYLLVDKKDGVYTMKVLGTGL